MTRVLPAIVALVISACPAQGTVDEPAWKFELRKDGDSITVEREEERATFVISSKSGIGGATITRTAGEWPEHVTLRLRYASSRGFGNLEWLILRTDRLLVDSDLRHSGRMPFCFVDQNGKPEVINALLIPPHGLVNVKAVVKEEGLDVILPSHMLRGSPHLKISWIDAARF